MGEEPKHYYVRLGLLWKKTDETHYNEFHGEKRKTKKPVPDTLLFGQDIYYLYFD